MQTRFIIQDDYKNWLSLWEGYNSFYKRTVPSEITQKTWSRFLDPSEPMFAIVAELNGRIVGMTHYLFHRNTALLEDICYLQDLFTLEEVRGQGIATALIEEVYKKAKENGSLRVYWQTHETNATAMALYDKIAEKSGFLVYRKQV